MNRHQLFPAWNEQSGAHTVEADIQFSDNPQHKDQAGPVPVNVKQPKIDTVSLHQIPAEFGVYTSGGTDFNGFHDGTPSAPGVTSDAKVDTPSLDYNYSGNFQFAFLQLVNGSYSYANSDGSQPVPPDPPLTKTTSGQYWLDNPPNGGPPPGGLMYPGSIQTVAQGSSNTPVGPVTDTPTLAGAFANYLHGPFPYAKNIQFDASFRTYLVFKSDNGIWVSLGSAMTFPNDEAPFTWSTGGAAFWDTTQIPAQWNITTPVNPDIPVNSTQGTTSPKFIGWADYWAK